MINLKHDNKPYRVQEGKNMSKDDLEILAWNIKQLKSVLEHNPKCKTCGDEGQILPQGELTEDSEATDCPDCSTIS
jgi:hypothetical protein